MNWLKRNRLLIESMHSRWHKKTILHEKVEGSNAIGRKKSKKINKNTDVSVKKKKKPFAESPCIVDGSKDNFTWKMNIL